MDKLVEKNIAAIKTLCDNFNVDKLYVFGSASTDNFTKDSDLDFLVSFNKEIPLLEFSDNFFEFHSRLKSLFDRNVDLITEKSIQNPYLARSISKTKQKIYDREGEKVSL